MGKIKDIVSKRHLIFELAKSDFKKRFVGSYLGLFWMFVQPVVTVFIYYMVFQLGFRSKPVSEVPYVLWLIAGLVPWFFFNEALMTGTGSLYDYSYLVKKVVFKVSILPLVKVLSAAFVHVIFVMIAVAVYLLYGNMPTIYWIQLPFYSFCTFLLALGLSYMTSAINVFFKDMGQIVGIILQFGMWVTPIMWDMYSLMPEKYWFLLKINPMFFIVEGYRDCFITKKWFWEHTMTAPYFLICVLVIFALGSLIFKKLKPHFADVL